MFVLLLTNRVHAARARRPAKVISDVRADLADAAVASVVDNPDNVIAMPRTFRADKAAGWNRPARVARKPRSKSRSGKAVASKSAGSKSTAKKGTSSSGKSTAKGSSSKSSTSKSSAKKVSTKSSSSKSKKAG